MADKLVILRDTAKAGELDGSMATVPARKFKKAEKGAQQGAPAAPPKMAPRKANEGSRSAGA